MIKSLSRRYLPLLLLVILLCLSGCAQKGAGSSSDQVEIKLPNNYVISAEVVDTPVERDRGLSGRTSLAANAGMWFVFDQDGRYSFWMPNMNFAIDIIWIDSDFRIVEIISNVLPEPGVPDSQLKLYINQLPARYALEVPAGTANAHKLEVGSGLQLISS